MEETMNQIDKMCKKHGVQFKVSDMENRLTESYTSFMNSSTTIDTWVKEPNKYAKWALENRMGHFLRFAATTEEDSTPPEWIAQMYNLNYDKFQKELLVESVYEEQMEIVVIEKLNENPREYCSVFTEELVAQYDLRKIFDKNEAEEILFGEIWPAFQQFADVIKKKRNFKPLLTEWTRILEEYFISSKKKNYN